MSRRKRERITLDRLEEFIARTSGERLPLRVAELVAERGILHENPKRAVELLDPIAKRLRAEASDHPDDREFGRALGRVMRQIVRARLNAGIDIAAITTESGEAVELSAEFGSESEHVEALLLDGELLTALGLLEEAATLRERAVTMASSNVAALLPHALAARADLHVRQGRHKAALRDCDEGDRLLESLPPEQRLESVFAEIALLLSRTTALRPTDSDGALESATRAIHLARTTEGRSMLPGAICYALYPMLNLGTPTEALDLALEGLKVARDYGTVATEAELQGVIAMIRAQSGDHDGAEQANREVVTLARRTGSDHLLLHALTGIGDNLRERQEYPEAARHYREAFDLLPSDSPNEYRSYLLLRLGEMATQQDANREAEEYYRLGLAESEEIGLKQGREDFAYLLGRLFLKTGRPEEARTWFERAVEEIEEENPRSFGVNALTRLAELEASDGEYRSAFERLQRYAPLKLQLELLYRENELQSTLQRHEREQAEQRAVIERLERKRAEEETRRRRAEVERAAFDLTEKGELIHAVERTIRELLARETTNDEVERTLRSILGTIEAHTATNGVAMTYQRSVDPEFYAALRTRHPDLTPGQIRLCGFLRAGLTSADIAGILYITQGAVSKQRSRLRRVLGLSRKQSLEHYLRATEPG